MELIQQTANCSDFDVALQAGSTPVFRALLPEYIHGKGLTLEKVYFHTIPGTWNHTDEGIRGKYSVASQLEISVCIEKGDSKISVELGVKNISTIELTELWAEICVGLNHLPGTPGWSNEQFLPAVPKERTVQGQWWYEKATPHRLFALTVSDWIEMHPNPDNPDVDKSSVYLFAPSDVPEARACALESLEGETFLFQAWNRPCHWCTPHPQNACMHLRPLISEKLSPGEYESIRGKIGIHRGTRESLELEIRRFEEEAS